MSTTTKIPTTIAFEVNLTNDFFPAHARQQLSANLSLFELIDNALSNPRPDQQAQVVLSVTSEGEDKVRFTIADWGRGMDEQQLVNALQFGSAHKDEGYLCIYGVGLCNALLALSQHQYDWTVASRKAGEKAYHVVSGPFNRKMEMANVDILPYAELVTQPELDLFGESSTLISVVADYRTASTMLTNSGQSAPSKIRSMNVLRRAMMEHIGVRYCKVLEPNESGSPAMRVLIPEYVFQSGKKKNVFVKPITQPYCESHTICGSVILNGKEVALELTEGILDKTMLPGLVMGGYAPEYYYQGNSETEGIDIIMGDRTIATAQLDTIWNLKRHPRFNMWTGRLMVDVSDLPRGFLNTLANKSGIDVNDAGWQTIFEWVRENATPRENDITTMEGFRKNYQASLRTLHPDCEVVADFPVYASRAKVDIVLVNTDGKTCEAYYTTKRTASFDDLAALRAKWDGLVAANLQPTVAYLICKKAGPMVKTMAEEWNKCGQLTIGLMAPAYLYNIVVKEEPNLPD